MPSRRPPEIEVLLLAARQHLDRDAADRIAALCREKSFRWAVLAATATRHEIAPLVLTNLQQAGAIGSGAPSALVERIVERWKDLKLRNVLNKKRQAEAAGRVIAFFAKRGVRVMLVKGAAMDAVVYAEPWYTQSIDVDLLVDQPYPFTDRAVEAAIFAMCETPTIEIDFLRHHDLDMNGVVDVDYTRLWTEARTIDFQHVQAYIMSPEDMLLSACVNLCRKRYRLLKGMLAIRELIETHPDLDWEKLGQIAGRSGASRFVYTAITMTDQVLGCDLPSTALAALAVDAPRGWLIRRLLGRISAQLFAGAAPRREPWGARLTSELLRLTTYRARQLRREVFAQLKVHREVYPARHAASATLRS